MDHRFELFPKVVISNALTHFSICSLNKDFVLKDDQAVYLRMSSLRRDAYQGSYEAIIDQVLMPQNNKLSFDLQCKGQQEHKLELIIPNQETIEFRIYSVEKELWSLQALKGDLHMHTTRSDGKEEPGFVSSMCRQIGLDFMAITDHGQYEPSLEAIDLYKDLHLDLKMFPGEEVHGKNNAVHIINFGGNFSINTWMREHPNKLNEAIEQKKAQIHGVNDEQSRFEIACSEVIFDKIREAQGLGIFCHPYWQIHSGYYISEEVTSYMLKHQPYDAYEVIGGYHPYEQESNTLQIARYYEERALARAVPIVGVSDAHGCFNELFGWFYTIVFAKSSLKEDLVEAIKSCRSVAVSAIPNQSPQPVGPFELVMFSLFLMREVFPLHDALCKEEGQWMMRHFEKDPEAKNELNKLSGQTEVLMDKIYGRKS
jgi:hypothetical protein